MRDCGPGASSESLARIFDALYSAKAGGLGLESSICGSIVEAHGGRLWATPNEPHQCDMKTGTVMLERIPLVVPPRMASRRRGCP
ncbi:ATP-binding protein [Bradyrhizobium sp.]|uniref:ATP-binding protein n=1 Tax=Bradyrhizobium sp. TaxID=376 RepID=UPI003C6FAC54